MNASATRRSCSPSSSSSSDGLARLRTVFSTAPRSSGSSTVAVAIALGLLGGAVAKSAQLPLHTWLPDAMEGPTPVSALIHAATMVTAGVYLVARMHVLFEVAVDAHDTVAILGAITLFAAGIAIVQTDIKRVLAYSTMSQIGYMVVAVGLGEYSAGMFHLLTHAFFKALLFLARRQRDPCHGRRAGHPQVRRAAPPAAGHVQLFPGGHALALRDPAFRGFWSKDMILAEAFSRDRPAGPESSWRSVWSAAFMTAFYAGRLWWIAFMGKPSRERPVEHPHGGRRAPVMLIPVIILAALTSSAASSRSPRCSDAGPQDISTYLEPVAGRFLVRRPVRSPVTIAILIVAAIFFVLPYFSTWPPAGARLVARGALGRRLLEHKCLRRRALRRALRANHRRHGSDRRQRDRDPAPGRRLDRRLHRGDRRRDRFSLLENGYFRSYMVVFVIGALIAVLITLDGAVGDAPDRHLAAPAGRRRARRPGCLGPTLGGPASRSRSSSWRLRSRWRSRWSRIAPVSSSWSTCPGSRSTGSRTRWAWTISLSGSLGPELGPDPGRSVRALVEAQRLRGFLALMLASRARRRASSLRHGPAALLRLLGGDADPALLPDRLWGGAGRRSGDTQVRDLHAGRVAPDAGRGRSRSASARAPST